jgi:hypothetical protein
MAGLRVTVAGDNYPYNLMLLAARAWRGPVAEKPADHFDRELKWRQLWLGGPQWRPTRLGTALRFSRPRSLRTKTAIHRTVTLQPPRSALPSGQPTTPQSATLAEPRVRPASTPFRSRERLDGAGARRARCRGMDERRLATSGLSA